MSNIKELPIDLINKIAAGEVVERPSSVLKELIENSLDAKAKNIIVEAKNGGVNLLKVVDDGIGMDQEDAKLCLKRYATSKIQNFDDFKQIKSFGFRGEALASISAVSRFFLETKQSSELEGIRLQIINTNNDLNEWGEHLDIKPVACNVGTTVCVQDLFYNVPARRKFLKSIGTEYNWLLTCINQFAVINHGVSFKFVYNDREIFHYQSVHNWESRVQEVFGNEISNDLILVRNNQFEIKINGFIGKPQSARNNRKNQYIYINGRCVNDFMISKAVKDSYGTLLPKDLHPVFVLNLELNPELVDVNVHPRKTEVKFMYPQIVYRCVHKVIKQVLDQNSLIPSVSLPNQENFYSNQNIPTNQVNSYKLDGALNKSTQHSLQQSYKPLDKINDTLKMTSEILSMPVMNEQKLEDVENFLANTNNAWKIHGQIHKSYILVESPSGLIIIDQHAAAERVLYQKLKKQVGQVKKQNLLIPVVIEVSNDEVDLMNLNKRVLEESGFDVEIFGTRTFKVTAIPQELNQKNVKTLILEIIGDLQKSDINKIESSEDRRDLIIKYASCRGAIKFNDVLTIEEQEALVRDIHGYDVVTCPHGRPAYVELSLNDLAKNFMR